MLAAGEMLGGPVRRQVGASTIGGAWLGAGTIFATRRERRYAMARDDALGLDMIRGGIAGAIATWVMGQVTSYLYELEDQSVRRREEQVRGTPAYQVAAERMAALARLSLTEAELSRAGQALHWGLGIGMGALYGALRPRVAGVDAAQGLAFGLAFFLLIDEGMNTAFGFAKPPADYPWQAHARGLAGHLVYGLATDASLDLLDRAA